MAYLEELKMIDFKKLSLALIISFNANADFFGDVGDFFEENATEVALVGIGALTVATIAIKPIRGLIRMEREAVALETANAARISKSVRTFDARLALAKDEMAIARAELQTAQRLEAAAAASPFRANLFEQVENMTMLPGI